MSILQEILSQMYIDPELLEQLSQEQQDILFRKMREEQVRRWRVREAELEKRTWKRTKRKINFALGADGNPWVWVMGEHKDDLPYNELVRRREMEEMEREQLSELQDRKEAEELAKLETRGILSLAKVFGAIHAVPKQHRVGRGTDSTNGGSVVEEDESSSKQLHPETVEILSPPQSVIRTESQLDVKESPTQGSHSKQQAMDEEERKKKTLVKTVSVIGATPEEHVKFEKQRTEEVFHSLRRARSITKKRAEDMAKNVEHWWQESEKKAKEFERFRRNSFKKAQQISTTNPDIPEKILEAIPVEKKKEIIRRMSVHDRGPRRPARQAPRPFTKQSSFVKPGTVPKSSAHVTKWFNDNEAPKGVGKEKDGSISIWFHGKLGREASAKLLELKPAGSFLVRLSSKMWGYTVTVKTYTDCKHFLIDASSGKYCFLGPKQQKFNSLPELLRFYRVNPITWSGQEVLLIPLGQEDERVELYRGLYNDEEDISGEIPSRSLKHTEYSGSTL